MSAPSGRFGSGVIWSGATAAAGVLLPFCLFVYFTRLVAPADIGLVAVAIALSEILKAVGLPGVYEALLEQKPVRRTAYETALAMLLCAGGLMGAAYLVILYGLSRCVVPFHDHLGLLALIGLRIPLDLASIQPQAALAERLAYGRLALRTIIGNGLAGMFGVAASRWTSPLDGLVCYQVGQSCLTAAVTMIGAGAIARPRLHRDEVRSLAAQTGFATGNRLIAATINSLDQLILAVVAGDVQTAYYNLGKRLETTFVTVANTFATVLFQPLFSRSSGSDLRHAARRGILTVLVTCGLPAAVVAANGRFVVTSLFGHQWGGAAAIASLLALSGLARGLGMIPGSILSVSGRNRELLVTSVVSAAGGLLIVAVLGPVSLAGCAGALAAKNGAIAIWLGVLARRHPGPVVRRRSCVLAALAASVLGIALARFCLEARADGWAMLVAMPAAAVIAAGFARRTWFGLVACPAVELTGADR